MRQDLPPAKAHGVKAAAGEINWRLTFSAFYCIIKMNFYNIGEKL